MRKQRMLACLMFVLTILTSQILAQVAINTDGSTYDPSSMLDVKSSTKGFLPPRVALTAVNVASPVTSPAVGLMVYNTATAGTVPNNVYPGNYYWNGTRWIPLTAPLGVNTGDMLYWNGSQWTGVPVGTNGQALLLNGAIPTWGQQPVTSPTVSTNPVSNLSSISATCGGNVNDGGTLVTARGVCWGTSTNPTVAGSKTTDGAGAGSFTSNITGLLPSTLYHVRAYATNGVGTGYGSDVAFTTININTTGASNITLTTATSGGTISGDGGNPVTARGVCWSTSPNPTTLNSKTTDGSGIGTFTSNLTGLTGNTTYYVRAYATNSLTTMYGNEITFTTNPTSPVVNTTDSSNVTQTTAMTGGEVMSECGAPVTIRGVCWNTSSNPTISNNKTINGSGIGAFASLMTALTPNTTYYVRAYASNSVGTSYGNNIIVKTKGTLPVVTTDEVTSITSTTALAFGNVTAGGNPTATERGFCWRTSPNPTINHSKLACGSGAGAFNGTLDKLAPNTTYHIRAYATNSAGTTYGADMTFTTTNAYYEGFETGFPTTWSGNGWGVTTVGLPYELYHCLISNQKNDSVQFTRSITTSPFGYISFYSKEDYNVQTSFYIDGVLKATFNNNQWSIHSYSFLPGTHIFKWVRLTDNNIDKAYIDYIIVSP